jgi:hypothetical protein
MKKASKGKLMPKRSIFKDKEKVKNCFCGRSHSEIKCYERDLLPSLLYMMAGWLTCQNQGDPMEKQTQRSNNLPYI